MITQSAPISIEVAVQDCFFQPRQQTSPIADSAWEDWFQQWLTALRSALPELDNSFTSEAIPEVTYEQVTYELCLRLTDDAEIRSLNATYRQKDQPTDVLAFAALELSYPRLAAIQFPIYLGDIVISVETAQQQAAQRQHSLRQELAWLAAHALLHLLGWDHPDEDSLLSMLEQQRLLLQAIGLTLDYDSAASN